MAIKKYRATNFGHFTTLFVMLAFGVGIFFGIKYDWNVISWIAGAGLLFFAWQGFFHSIGEIKITNLELQIKSAFSKKEKSIPFQEINELLLAKNHNKKDIKNAKSLLDVDLELKDSYWEEHNVLLVKKSDNITFATILRSEFPEIREISSVLREKIILAKGNKTDTSIHTDKHLIEIEQLIGQTRLFIAKDQKLEKHLHETLYSSYSSVYKMHQINQLDSLPNTVKYKSAIDEGKHAYFLTDDYLANISDANIEVAENLIDTSEENLEVVQARLQTHQTILSQLTRLKQRREVNMKAQKQLAEATERLEELQQINSEEILVKNNLEGDTTLLEELGKLAEKTSQADSLEKSLELKTHIELIQQHLL